MRTWSWWSRRVGREGAGRLGPVAGRSRAFPRGHGLGTSGLGRARRPATAPCATRVAPRPCGGVRPGGQGAGGTERGRGGAPGRAGRGGGGLWCGSSGAGASHRARARAPADPSRPTGAPCRDTCRSRCPGSSTSGRGNGDPAASVRSRDGGATGTRTGRRAERAGVPHRGGICARRGDPAGTIVRRSAIGVGGDTGGDGATRHCADIRDGAIARASW
jgi:hypothetical protein